jgi:hypothetical protein
LDPGSLQLDDEQVLCCRVKQGRARARFSRDAQFALGSLVEQRGGGEVLRVGAREHVLPPGLFPAIAES